MNVRTKSILASGLVIALSGTAFGVQQAITLGAEEPNPIIEQVQEHEGRIGTLEGRADETDAKTDQQAQTIQQVQTQVEAQASTATAAPTASAPTTSTTTSPAAQQPASVAPTPAPEPAKNPRTITGVRDTPTTNGMHSCDYVLYDASQNVTSFVQPAGLACHGTGEVLPYV